MRVRLPTNLSIYLEYSTAHERVGGGTHSCNSIATRLPRAAVHRVCVQSQAIPLWVAALLVQRRPQVQGFVVC
jgi:hypothetical protein